MQEMQPGRPKQAVILVADDNEADRDSIERTIGKGNIRCILKTVTDGEQLLKYLQRQPPYEDEQIYPWPDLLLLDINMPRISGKDALQQLRLLPAAQSLPVVMLTTSNREKDVFECYELGANAFITKPIEPQDFIDAFMQMESFWFELVTLPTTGNKH